MIRLAMLLRPPQPAVRAKPLAQGSTLACPNSDSNGLHQSLHRIDQPVNEPARIGTPHQNAVMRRLVELVEDHRHAGEERLRAMAGAERPRMEIETATGGEQVARGAAANLDDPTVRRQ